MLACALRHSPSAALRTVCKYISVSCGGGEGGVGLGTLWRDSEGCKDGG